MTGHTAITYRSEIDGLRAIAVMAVLLYHAHVPGFSGGFIGVDIFFVISGYLITGILAREIGDGTFTLMRFYERRARRILPALFAVSAVTLAAASWLFLPGDFERVPPSILAALGFASNVWFFTQTGYFQADAQSTPMLHTWSLGVEEQFYIGFPLLLLILHRFRWQWRTPAIVVIAAISLAWAIAKQTDTDGFAFYMLPTRAWELLAGSLIALLPLSRLPHPRIREALCWIALAVLGWTITAYGHDTIFPGLAAVPPVLATAVLICLAAGTRVAALLSMRGPVMLGLISYSLYLWHWPIIVFWQYAQDATLAGWQSGAAVVLSVVAGWLGWRFVEQPFRNPRTFPARRVFRFSAVAAGVLAIVATAMFAKGPWPERFDERTVQFAAGASDSSPARGMCISDQADRPDDDCVLGADRPPSALLWGDSHGVELAWVMGEELGKQGRSIVQRTRASCPPTLGYNDARDPGCREFNEAVMQQIERSKGIETVYLAGFWASETYSKARVDRLIDGTIARLHKAGKRVVLIGPVPPQHSPVPRRLALQGSEAETLDRREFAQHTDWFTRHFAHWRSTGATVLEPDKRLFSGDKSIIVADGKPLYFDSHHLSLAGARYVLAGSDWFSGNEDHHTPDRNSRQQRAHGASAATGNRPSGA
ncbi:MAG: acyltransferase [Sphingomonadaceae bacterium]|nr:acyltransferase [Sphingomonadaceae bacterium]